MLTPTMERTNVLCRVTLTIVAAFALSCVGLAALQVREAAVTVANDTDLMTTHGVDLVEDARQTAEQSRHVLLDSRVAISNLNKAAIAERLYAERELPDTVEHFNDVLDAARTSVAGLQDTERATVTLLGTVNARAVQAEQIETNGATALRSMDLVFQHMDDVVMDPHVAATLQHVDDASAAGASTMQHANAAAADTQQAWHSVLHPAWPHRVWRAICHPFRPHATRP